MNITTEMASRSLNHVGEILCGDRVQFVHRQDSDILVLADGMGSGVRANMLSTLTSQIFGKMLLEGIRGRQDGGSEPAAVSAAGLLLQGLATSIDALSVGFTIADYPAPAACVEALIIGVVTFGICMIGLRLGKRFGTRLAGKASILGGVILIAIGIEIFLKGILS